MAGRNRSSYRSRARAPRAGRWFWDTVSTSNNALATGVVSASNLLPTGTLAQAMRNGTTVTRIVGNLSIRPTSNDLSAIIDWAIYPQQLEGFSAGAHPELLSDLFPYLIVDRKVMTEGAILDAGMKTLNVPVDIKQKRRFRSADDTLIFQIANNSVDAANVEWDFLFRILLRIP